MAGVVVMPAEQPGILRHGQNRIDEGLAAQKDYSA
jgi:hypothetical protein